MNRTFSNNGKLTYYSSYPLMLQVMNFIMGRDSKPINESLFNHYKNKNKKVLEKCIIMSKAEKLQNIDQLYLLESE